MRRKADPRKQVSFKEVAELICAEEAAMNTLAKFRVYFVSVLL